ncbi:MAG: alkaline shock response membrane anchor protein AmaP [Anaerolineae bacterium]|nr:alkaline shock response membrane anchor protein AmaP [Anaerolineae bacterium]
MMNIFNRVVMVILLLLALAVSYVFTIIPVRLLDLVSKAITLLAQSVEMASLVFVLIGIAFIMLWFLLLVLELWRPPKRTVRVEKVSGGQVEMTVDAISQRVVYRVDQMADVVTVKPRIRAGRGGVDIDLDLETTPDIDVPTKTEEVCAAVKDVIEERMGLRLNRIRVKVRHAPYAEG